MTIDKQGFMDQIANRSEINSLKRKKKLDCVYKNISKSLVEKHLDEGWEVDKELKTKYKVKKKKPLGEIFEDQMWLLMAELGFKELNKDSKFKIKYGKDGSENKKIEVFAKDDETVLLFECKSSEGEPKKSSFKEDIESIGEKKQGINQ